MNHPRLTHLLFLLINLGVILLILSTATATTPLLLPSKSAPQHQETIEFLLLLSPQYKDDSDIHTVIQTYTEAVTSDLGWTTQLHPVSSRQNTYPALDELIETYHKTYHTHTCLFIGEDLALPTGGSTTTMQKPSIIPYATIGGTQAYETTNQGIISTSYTLDICIALLMPAAEHSYRDKKAQLINTLHRFSTQREHLLHHESLIMEGSELASYTEGLYQTLLPITESSYIQDPTTKQRAFLFSEPYDIVCLHGHSNPSTTQLNAEQNVLFSARELSSLQAPLVTIDGCYVNGWWNDDTTSSYDQTTYATQIFDASEQQVVLLGLLSQPATDSATNIVSSLVPALHKGNTLSNALRSHHFIGDFVVIGDPTFHYCLD